MPVIITTDGEWWVTTADSKRRIGGPFTTNARAWSWADAHDPDDAVMRDRQARIHTPTTKGE